jgi:uncharacterized protein YjbJ (UPF0337 family)
MDKTPLRDALCEEIRLNWDRIEQDWQGLKVKAQQRWERLSEHELKLVAGSRDALRAKIQQAYGIHKDEADLQIDQWVSEQGEQAPAHQNQEQGGQSQFQSGFC